MRSNGKVSALRECIKYIEEQKKKDFEDDDSALTIEDGEEAFTISDKHIFLIPEIEDFRTIGFVDGGTEPIIKGSDFSINLCRVAGIISNSKNIIFPQKVPLIIEFYSATISEKNEKGEVVFRTRYFSKEDAYKEYLPQTDLIIPYKDSSIRIHGKFIMPIENHGTIAMRFSEWAYAKHFIQNELNNRDIFIRDGSLQTGYPGEARLANEVYSAGINKKVYITGLSKSCRILNKSGTSLNAQINIVGNSKYPTNSWYYYPTMKLTKADNQADLFFVKLNKNSPYSFRFDIYLEQSNLIDKKEREIVISNIANNADDPTFLGYPYGLIKVDQLARISKKEVESEKIQLLTEFDKNIFNKYILSRLRSIDAHDILNKIRK